jgi:F-type H+-transporting ATPase subunit delta
MLKASLQKISRKYAEALAKQNLDLQLIDDLQLVKDCFESSEELRTLMDHPYINPKEKHFILDKLFAKKVDRLVLNTLHLLLDRRRLAAVTLLRDSYQEIYNREENIEAVQLKSAHQINQDSLSKIKANLEDIFDADIELSNELDESLIAGVKLKIGDRVFDASLKSKLKQMKDLLLS